MKQRQPHIAILLMIISLVLMLAFQAYWLRQAYRDEFFSLRREAGLLLRETSLNRQLRFFFGDTSRLSMDTGRGGASGGSISVRTTEGMPLPVVISQGGRITENTDSGVKMILPRPGRGEQRVGRRLLWDENSERGASTLELKVVAPFPLGNAPVESLDSSYRRALAERGINLPYSLRLVSDSASRRNNPNIGSIQVNDSARNISIGLNLQMVEARFAHPRWHLLRHMWPQIGFALLLLATTVLAFWVLYKNLLQQQRLAAQKNELISNITHELKTPIATVSVAVEALKNFNALEDKAKTQEYLNISGNELQRLNLLVDKVLRLGMFENNTLELKPERIDLLQQSAEVAETMSLQLARAGASLRQTHAGQQFWVNADRLHLQSVLYNLLDNAIKYSPNQPSLHLHVEETEKDIVLSVTDNGIGIPSAYQQRIFEKFFRVPHGNTHNFKGYGLGLSYVNEIVVRMQGRIAVQSVPQQGSTFSIFIPKANTA